MSDQTVFSYDDTDTRLPMTAVLLGGGISGVIAGVVMMIAAMLVANQTGMGMSFPLKLVAGFWLGVQALLGGSGAVILGAFTHLVVSSILGAIFAALIRWENSTGLALVEGVVYGILVWGLMTFLIVPFVDPTLSGRVPLMAGWWFVYHLIFGCVLLITPFLMQALAPAKPVAPARYEKAA